MHEVFSYLRQNTYIFPLFLFKATDPDVGNVRRSILHLDQHMHVATRSVISRHVFLSGLECLSIALNIADYSRTIAWIATNLLSRHLTYLKKGQLPYNLTMLTSREYLMHWKEFVQQCNFVHFHNVIDTINSSV